MSRGLGDVYKRQTLMDRLTRIASILNVDLDDVDQRLELMIIERVYLAQANLVCTEENEDRWNEDTPPPLAFCEPHFQAIEHIL